MATSQPTTTKASGKNVEFAPKATVLNKNSSSYIKLEPVSPTTDFLLTATFFVASVFAFYAIWNEGGTSDVLLLIGLLIFVTVAVQINKMVFRWIAKTVSSQLLYGPPFNNPMKKRKNMKKWMDQSWQFTIHVTMTILEMYVLMDEEWYTNTRSLWEDSCPMKELKFSMKFLYVTQLAIWIWTAFSHRFIEERRADYIIMYFHHIFTILLVAGSWYARQPNIGVSILYIHDSSDIFVDITKMFNYLKLEGKAGFYISEINYFSCLAAWFYYRLYIFPFRILKSTIWEAHRMCNPGKPWGGHPLQKPIPDVPSIYLTANLLLLALLSFHIYWFLLLLRVGYRSIYATTWHDVGAQEYEGGSASESEKEH